MPTREGEDGVDAAGAQPSGDQMSGVDRRLEPRCSWPQHNRDHERHLRHAGADRRRRPDRLDGRHRTRTARHRMPHRRPAASNHRSMRKPLGCNPARSRCSRAWACCAASSTRRVLMRGQIVYVNGERVIAARHDIAGRRAVRLHRHSAVRHRGASCATSWRCTACAVQRGAAGHRLRAGRRRRDRHPAPATPASRRCGRLPRRRRRSAQRQCARGSG